ncbi:hypothetical protein IP92_04534 [Pseudoduganella flava]|uniref:Uncharacterized protein n=1 Tax=Pseudoduganella flava TaxID=871742 RepID=A0A562PJ36_9BURK|nr:hypothetical protein IP92_04534 [Pseudoduganella flava]
MDGSRRAHAQPDHPGKSPWFVRMPSGASRRRAWRCQPMRKRRGRCKSRSPRWQDRCAKLGKACGSFSALSARGRPAAGLKTAMARTGAARRARTRRIVRRRRRRCGAWQAGASWLDSPPPLSKRGHDSKAIPFAQMHIRLLCSSGAASRAAGRMSLLHGMHSRQARLARFRTPPDGRCAAASYRSQANRPGVLLAPSWLDGARYASSGASHA